MDNFEAYGEMMKKMYADAIAVAEKVKDAAMDDRHAAAEELSKARDTRKAAEQNGEKIALRYFAERHATLVKQTRQETLSALVVNRLKEGKSKEEIMHWLEVKEDFINHCKIILQKENELFDTPHMEYSQSGRGGTIYYVAGFRKIPLDWEFAGGNGVAIIFIPEEKYWLAQTGFPVFQRPSILEFIAKQVVKDQAPGCVYSISDNFIEILYA